MNQIEGLADFTPRLHRCRGRHCRAAEKTRAQRAENQSVSAEAVEKVCAALWPAPVKEGGGRGKSLICVRRVDTVWNRFDRTKIRWCMFDMSGIYSN